MEESSNKYSLVGCGEYTRVAGAYMCNLRNSVCAKYLNQVCYKRTLESQLEHIQDCIFNTEKESV